MSNKGGTTQLRLCARRLKTLGRVLCEKRMCGR
jgi:hypothetical protein